MPEQPPATAQSTPAPDWPGDLSTRPEISCSYLRASGPGGQHVNTSDSAVQLRFRISDSSLLDEQGKARLRRLARRQINARDELVITASEQRSQLLNKQAALARLRQYLEMASRPPKPRRKTKVPAASKLKRLENKRILAEKKRLRQGE
ncbi:MAG: aminoacyl-tRNA hydrolase [Lentisphaerae bacterium]|nr:aminoacyl-tRNA hydrolase [Lentisphaerota bacterium]